MAIHFPDIDPVAFSIGPLDIRWYALSYITGFILGYIYCIWLLKKICSHANKITADHLDALLLWLIIGVILGGRSGYVLFYNAPYFLSHPVEIFYIHHGGMSFHGGLLGAGISLYLFSKVHKVSFLALSDLVAAAAPIGLFFGRIANFINAELYGRTSSLPWAVIFPNGGDVPRHPSQLYEALLEGLVLWLVMLIFILKNNAIDRKGQLTGLFLAGYGIMRFIVEFFRLPDAQIGFIFEIFTMGQILCLPMIFLGLWLIYYQSKKTT